MSTGTNYGYDQPGDFRMDPTSTGYDQKDGRRMDPTNTEYVQPSDPVSYNTRGHPQHGPYIVGHQEFNIVLVHSPLAFGNECEVVCDPYAKTYHKRKEGKQVKLKKCAAVWSIFNCLFCCPILGLAALICVLSSRSSESRREFALAESELDKGKIINMIATGIGVLTAIVLIICLH